VCSTECLGDPLYRYTSSQAASHFCPPTRNAITHARLRACVERLWAGPCCDVFRCDACGFGFGHPFVGGDEEFYALLHESVGYPRWKWDYEVGSSVCENYNRGGRILDIGAGHGYFLRQLSGSWQCFATEGSSVTREHLRANGVTVFDTLDAAVQHASGTFTVVTLFQVLEHLSSFGKVLRQCRQLVTPDGSLVIVVPSGDAMIAQERVTGCADMPPNHIAKWTPASLARALRDSGFQPGTPIYQPAELKNIPGLLHLRLKSDAMSASTAAAHAYRIRSRRLRAGVLSVMAVGALIRMLPQVAEWPLSGAFAMTAQPARG
jgi:2-polyprenyl-3-methyl-5-hydroxy-6-metoxy-1,4-benzoquinol methylase